MAALVVGFSYVFVMYGLLGGGLVGQSRPPTAQQLFQALAGAEKQAAIDAKHPLVYLVHLTPAAYKVADAFVYAEYVTHDCKALARLTKLPPGLKAQFGPIGSGNCADTLQGDRQNDSHLVRGSRLLQHDCNGYSVDPLYDLPLKVNECLRYSTIGRYITLDSGKRYRECDGSFFQVFLMRMKGRWFVVAEQDTDDWGGGCTSGNLATWNRRFPWRS